MKLLVTNPGYAATEAVEADGVEVLGVMDHNELFEKISNSLCYFGMQTHPENFGIIFAECHAINASVAPYCFRSAAAVKSPHFKVIIRR